MYKLKSQSNIFTDDILEVVCRNRGIENVEKIKHPSKEDLIHYSKLVNMDKAVEVFSKYAEFDEVEIGMIVDQDADGYTSSAILTMYLEKFFPNIKINHYFHEGKQHGITKKIMKQIKNTDNLSLLFVPDAGSNNYDEHKELYDNNIAVIVLDHHECPKLSEYAIVVNNQLSPEYDNKYLSGVGVVYKFLCALDDLYGFNGAEEYSDVVAIGLVADIMSMTEPENRYLVYNGISNLKNDYIKEMVFKNIGKYEKVYPHSLSFNFIPKTNAIIRFSTMEDKQDLFKALIGVDEIFYNTRSKKEETLPQKATRLGTNAHKRQGDTKKKWLKVFREQIENEGLDKNAFIIVKIDENTKFDNELTGVLASALSGEYRKPVLILHYNRHMNLYTGSLRGHDSVLKDTKGFLSELELFEFIEGHGQAAGCGIKLENLEQLNNVINQHKQFELSSNESITEVDFVVSFKNLNSKLIEEVYSYEKYWGKGIEMPLFAITDIEIDTSKIKVSDNGLIKWFEKGIEFAQFIGDKNFIKIAEQDKTVKLNVIGSLGINSFLGNTTPQVIINEIEVVDIQDKKQGFEFIW